MAIDMAALPAARLAAAVKLYQDRKARTAHPDGTFDKKRRWYPSPQEQQSCCYRLRGPSVAYPYSYMTHCRTADHIARMFDMPASEIRKQANAGREKPTRLGGIFYKAVLKRDGRYFSIFDPGHEYVIGQTYVERVRKDHGGGYYVRATVDSAREAGREAVWTFASLPVEQLPSNISMVVLKVECSGQYTRYECACALCTDAKYNPYSAQTERPEHTKYAFSSVTPLGEV